MSVDNTMGGGRRLGEQTFCSVEDQIKGSARAVGRVLWVEFRKVSHIERDEKLTSIDRDALSLKSKARGYTKSSVLAKGYGIETKQVNREAI